MPTLAIEKQLLKYVNSNQTIRQSALNYTTQEALHSKYFIQQLNDPMAIFLFSKIEEAKLAKVSTLALENQLFNYTSSPKMQSKISATLSTFLPTQQSLLEKSSDNKKRKSTVSQTVNPENSDILHGYQMHQKKQKKLSSETDQTLTKTSKQDPKFD